jgi:hypothetical protein
MPFSGSASESKPIDRTVSLTRYRLTRVVPRHGPVTCGPAPWRLPLVTCVTRYARLMSERAVRFAQHDLELRAAVRYSDRKVEDVAAALPVRFADRRTTLISSGAPSCLLSQCTARSPVASSADESTTVPCGRLDIGISAAGSAIACSSSCRLPAPTRSGDVDPLERHPRASGHSGLNRRRPSQRAGPCQPERSRPISGRRPRESEGSSHVNQGG